MVPSFRADFSFFEFLRFYDRPRAQGGRGVCILLFMKHYISQYEPPSTSKRGARRSQSRFEVTDNEKRNVKQHRI